MNNSFADLGVVSFFIDRLAERGISAPTRIQSLVIPELLQGRNTLFSSATGTGKTFAFLIPLFQTKLNLSPEKQVSGAPLIAIAAPTYELCSQIKKEADFLLQGTSVKVSLLIGSANISRQIDGLKKDKPQVIIGNPGRLLQLCRMGKLKLQKIQALVLDEGDRLVSDELFAEIKELESLIAKDRISTACSATINFKNKERLLPFLGNDAVIKESPEEEIIKKNIEHWAFYAEDRKKIAALRSFVSAVNPKKLLVFVDNNNQVTNILSQLQYHKIAAGALSGSMDKKGRKMALDDFRAGRIQVLVTSDLSARGLDIEGVTHIAALDVPQKVEAYIHRAGRTARAGKKGIAATIGNSEELPRLASIEKKLGIIVYPKVLYKGQVCAPEEENPEEP
ncbi:MAG: DEAD/DEAH box helicase [Treponema sp.]|jgi:superfamily II DNA/RNA helicase|nr:DEAD/DEAH box helicase [Treponema sp.]